MDTWLLKLILLFRVPFTRQGIDVDKMAVIVQTKLIMDKRRVYLNFGQRQEAENRNHLNKVLIMYGIFGLFMGALIINFPSFVLSMIIFHGYVFFMIAMTLITDFSTVLLDTTDNQIILPTPVNSRTLFMARLAHILIYLLQFTLALSVLPIAATFYKYRFLTGSAMIATAFLTVLLSVFSTYLLYLLVLRFSSERKLREIVTNFQVFMSIFFLLGYQVIPRVINMSALSASFRLNAYAYFLPPVWMSLGLDALHSKNFDLLHISMLLASLIVPLFLCWVLIKFLAPSFSRKLGAMATDQTGTIKTRAGKKQGALFSTRVSKLVCRSATEQGVFRMVWKITARDKGFRLQFYPGLAIIPVFIFLFVLGAGQHFSSTWENLPTTRNYLWLVYLPMLAVSSSIIVSTFNENYQASWVYYSLPVTKPGEIISGAAKAMFVKYFFTCYLLLFVFARYIWGWRILTDFTFGLLNNFLCFLVFTILTPHYFPFSRPPGTQQQTGRFMTVLIQFVLVGILIGIHFLLIHLRIVMYLLMPLQVLACWLLLRELQDLPWKKIQL
jgi:ABC-2 type transport system permease protein